MDEIEATINGKQEKALELMLRGETDVAVAETIGVTRQTIRNWRMNDRVFRDTLEEARRELREKHRDSINGLVDKAIAVLEKALEEGDLKARIQAARLVLDMAGLKESGKGEKAQSKEEIFIEQLGLAFGEVAKELGYPEPGVIQNIDKKIIAP